MNSSRGNRLPPAIEDLVASPLEWRAFDHRRAIEARCAGSERTSRPSACGIELTSSTWPSSSPVLSSRPPSCQRLSSPLSSRLSSRPSCRPSFWQRLSLRRLLRSRLGRAFFAAAFLAAFFAGRSCLLQLAQRVWRRGLQRAWLQASLPQASGQQASRAGFAASAGLAAAGFEQSGGFAAAGFCAFGFAAGLAGAGSPQPSPPCSSCTANITPAGRASARSSCRPGLPSAR